MSLITAFSYRDLCRSYPAIPKEAEDCSICFHSLANGPEEQKNNSQLRGHVIGAIAHVFHAHCVKKEFSTGYGNCPECRAFLVGNTSVIVPFKSLEDLKERCAGAEDTCVVCQDPLNEAPEEDAQNRGILGHMSEKVGHFFHEHCMVQTLAYRQQCPSCRAELSVADPLLRQKVNAVIIPPPVASYHQPHNQPHYQPHVPQPPPTWEAFISDRVETATAYVVGVGIISALYSIVVGIVIVVDVLLSGAALLVALKTAVIVAGVLFLVCVGAGLAVGICLVVIDLALEGFAWAGRQIEQLFA